ncbi:unnamed protein product, partial [marine sediment metagenome]
MKNTKAIALKELKSYLTSPMAYVVTAIFLALTGTFFALSSSTYFETNTRGLWEFWGVLLLLLIASILTMRLIAEEKKMGTWELLLTAPVRDSEVILGKFLGSLAVLAGMLVLTLYYPILLILFGDPDMGPIFGSYLGLFLLGSTALAIGIFASSLTSNQMLAAVVAGGILFGLWFIGTAGSYTPGALGEVLS